MVGLRLAGAPPVLMLKLTGCGVPLVRETVTVAVTLPVPAIIEPLFGLTETTKSNGWAVTVKV
jgi:hypothetical protein